MEQYEVRERPFMAIFCHMTLFTRFVERHTWPNPIENDQGIEFFMKALKNQARLFTKAQPAPIHEHVTFLYHMMNDSNIKQ